MLRKFKKIVLFCAGGLTLLFFGQRLSHFQNAPMVLTVKKGMSLRDIEGRLTSQMTLFYPLMILQQEFFGTYVRPGAYRIPKDCSLRQIIHIFNSGPINRRITIPEGWTVQQIMSRMMGQGGITKTFLLSPPLEGTLFPATYDYLEDCSAQDLVNMMQKKMQKTIKNLLALYKLPAPLKTEKDLIILASIVERETSKASERSHVAAVYLNRLKKGMRLQADPTVIYGLSKSVLGRPLTLKDLKIKTSHNTYTNQGLPPTPIGCPGKASLEAVLTPSKIKDLFFVADGKGGHVFSETFTQHRQKVKKWHQIKKRFENQISSIMP